MRHLPLVIAAGALCPLFLPGDPQFEEPRALEVGGERIETEHPGYAAPTLADLDGDGIRDLLVGQYNEGKIAVYPGFEAEDGSLAFGSRQWLVADGEIAKVPGIW